MSGAELASWLGNEIFDRAFSAAVHKIIHARLSRARAILIEELEKGSATIQDISDRDEAAAMVFEYAEAARRGAARRNLRMLAQICAAGVQSPPIYADDFLRWSRLLADLNFEEIILLATYELHFDQTGGDDAAARALDSVKGKLLANAIFPNSDAIEAALHALSRTGLIIPKSGWDGTVFAPTYRLYELMKIIRIDSILAEPAR